MRVLRVFVQILSTCWFADHLHSVNSNRLSIQDRLSSSVKRNQLRVGLSVRVSVGLRVTGPVPIPTLHRTLSPTLRRTLSWLRLNHPLHRSHLRTTALDGLISPIQVSFVFADIAHRFGHYFVSCQFRDECTGVEGGVQENSAILELEEDG